jgi:hypothetical protein
MQLRPWLFAPVAALGFGAALLPAADPPPPEVPPNDTGITWKKTVLDTAFRSEGVTAFDVNKDGKIDIVNGEVWYEAPDWKMHEIRPSKNYRDGDKNIYSKSFACWAEDVNGDGWTDVIVIGFPGEPCYWYENPQGKDGHWKAHEIWHSACNETPQYVDLFGTGKRVLLMGWQPKGKNNEGQMAWFAPGDDPTKPWVMHAISVPSVPGKEVPGTQRFSHGLGVGDVNGDGRLDVIVPQGWWEQPPKDQLDQPWKFHPANLGDACADMYAYDVFGDGKAAIISSSAHGYGIWIHQQKPGNPDPTFVKHTPFPKFVSQTHAMVLADIDGDGLKDFVTGKRYWAHGATGDADPNAAAMLYWFQAKKKDGVVNFVPRVIDNDSGIGTQFYVADVNGDKLPDVVVSNKKGTFLFEQVRMKR